ncbi:MAG: TonB-dependent receptor [Bacteroidales bacterium]|nr:TonB-dependent receptor [Bacteroidales bacterium]
MALLFAATSVAAQQVHITLIDQISGEPMSFAHVLVEGFGSESGIKQGHVADFDGKVSFDLRSPAKITATFVGYKNMVDTIAPGETRTLEMAPSVYQFDEVVITAQFRPETVDKSIYNIKVLGSQQIESRAAVNLNEMLSGEINIRSTHDNALGSSISMQGLGGEHIKFLVDGVPVIGRQNGNIDLQQLNLQNIDHIEVIKGPMSVVYGSNALAGVINIITKDPDKQKVAVNSEAYFESVGQYNFSLGGSYAWKKNSFSLYGDRNFFDGYDPVDTTRFQQWKPKLQYDFNGSYLYRSKKTKLKLGGSYFFEEIRDKGNGLEVFNWDKAFDKYFFTKRWEIRGEINQQVLNRAMVNVLTAYSYYGRVKNTYIKDLTNLEMILVPEDSKQDTTRFDNLMLRADFNNYVNSEKFKYQLGVDLNHESAFGKRIENNTQQIGDYAAFLNLIVQPLPQLSIQPGLRVIYNTNYKAPLVYSLNTKWNINELLALRFSLAKGFRAPSLKELYLDFVDINHDIRGNPDLKAETSFNLNLAINYSSQSAATYNWGIEAGLFYNHIKDKIALVNVEGNDLLYTYINVDQYYTQGFDLLFNNSVYPSLKVILGAGLTGLKQYIEDANLNQDFVYTMDFSAQVNYLWRKPDLNFTLFYKYNGSYPQLTVGSNSNSVIIEYAAYNTLDVNVSRWFWKRRINVQFGGKNLFDVTNIISSGGGSGGGAHTGGGGAVPINWGRTYFIKLQFNFNK